MKHTSMVVTHAALKRDNAPWLVRASSAADANVEVLALRARCFSCPLPLCEVAVEALKPRLGELAQALAEPEGRASGGAAST